jgi:hypothetical protein
MGCRSRATPNLCVLTKRREDLAGEKAKLLHDVLVRHAGEIQTADQVVDAKRPRKR